MRRTDILRENLSDSFLMAHIIPSVIILLSKGLYAQEFRKTIQW